MKSMIAKDLPMGKFFVYKLDGDIKNPARCYRILEESEDGQALAALNVDAPNAVWWVLPEQEVYV